VPTFIPPFLLIRRDGQTTEFGDLTALACAVRESRIEISKYHVIEHEIIGGVYHKTIYNEWIVRDSFGQIVPKEAVWEAAPYRVTGYRRQYRSRLEQAQNAAALGLPIPYTGKRRGYSNYLRFMRTLGTNRARAGAMVDDRGAEIRPKGVISPRPTCWDDVPRTHTRSWKAHRKTQWKAH